MGFFGCSKQEFAKLQKTNEYLQSKLDTANKLLDTYDKQCGPINRQKEINDVNADGPSAKTLFEYQQELSKKDYKHRRFGQSSLNRQSSSISRGGKRKRTNKRRKSRPRRTRRV